jgi:hypothetical protein
MSRASVCCATVVLHVIVLVASPVAAQSAPPSVAPTAREPTAAPELAKLAALRVALRLPPVPGASGAWKAPQEDLRRGCAMPRSRARDAGSSPMPIVHTDTTLLEPMPMMPLRSERAC